MPRPTLSEHVDYESVVYFPVYAYRITIVFTRSIPKSTQARGHEEKRSMAEASQALHIYWDNCSELYFQIGVCPTGTVAHEAWHVVRRMMEYIGAELENEVIAYHIGHLVDKIVGFKNELIDSGVGVAKRKIKPCRKNTKGSGK